jgi:hypothetical protein
MNSWNIAVCPDFSWPKIPFAGYVRPLRLLFARACRSIEFRVEFLADCYIFEPNAFLCGTVKFLLCFHHIHVLFMEELRRGWIEP